MAGIGCRPEYAETASWRKWADVWLKPKMPRYVGGMLSSHLVPLQLGSCSRQNCFSDGLGVLASVSNVRAVTPTLWFNSRQMLAPLGCLRRRFRCQAYAKLRSALFLVISRLVCRALATMPCALLGQDAEHADLVVGCQVRPVERSISRAKNVLLLKTTIFQGGTRWQLTSPCAT